MKIITIAPYVGFQGNDMYKRADNGKMKIRALIVSDTLPQGFPASDAAVTEAFPDYVFDTLSIMQVLTHDEGDPSIYVVKEDGTWTAVEGSVTYLV